MTKPVRQGALLSLVAWMVLGAGCTASPHDLAARGDNEALEAQLQRNPDLVHALNRHDKTPAHFAASSNFPEVLGLLHKHGADLNAQDITGMTPLHVAAMFGRREALEWLLVQGADPHITDDFGDTPLHTAAAFGMGGVMGALLQAGLDFGLKNHAEHTPLDVARKYHQARVVEVLEKRGAPGQ